MKVQHWSTLTCGSRSSKVIAFFTSQAFVFGGFGVSIANRDVGSGNSHRRLSELCMVRLTDGECTIIGAAKIPSVHHAMHCSVVRVPSHSQKSHRFVVFGGRASPMRPTNEVHVVHVEEELALGGNVDYTLLEAESSCALSKPSPRWRHASSVLLCGGRSFMILTGGRNNDCVFGDFWSLDLDNFEWSEFCVKDVGDNSAPPPIFARHSHCADVWNANAGSSILISGGLDQKEKPRSDLLLLKIKEVSATAVVSRCVVSGGLRVDLFSLIKTWILNHPKAFWLFCVLFNKPVKPLQNLLNCFR